VRRDAAEARDRFRGEPPGHRFHLVQATDQTRGGAEIDQLLLEERVHDREQQRRVGAGTDEVMLARQPRRLRPSRIDHHHLAAALDDGLQPSWRVGHRHEAAVGDGGIGADDQQMMRAVDVGNRHRGRKLPPEHQPGLDDLRQGVDRGRVEEAAAPEGALEDGAIDQRTHVVHDGVAVVHPDRVAAVALADGDQARRDLLVGLVPADLFPAGGRAAHWPPQPLRIVVQLLQAVRLRADVAA
jgi:hypothetical protein